MELAIVTENPGDGGTTPTVPRPELVEAASLRRGPGAPRLFEGADHGGVELSFFLADNAPGRGPALHRHPYAEVFVVREGRAAFEVGGQVLEATAGQIVIAPPEQPHAFTNIGAGRLRTINLHPVPRPVTTWGENCASERVGAQAARIVDAASLPHGRFEGAGDGPAEVSLILDDSRPGAGPRLHRHPYSETWVIERGNLIFHVGDHHLQAGPGQIVVAPPDLPHTFINQGPSQARLVCIHASPTIRTAFLE